jgi:hypothetical protein
LSLFVEPSENATFTGRSSAGPHDADSLTPTQTLEQSDSQGHDDASSRSIPECLLRSIKSWDRSGRRSRRVVQLRRPIRRYPGRRVPSLLPPGVTFPGAEPFSSTVGGYRPPGLWIAITTPALPWLQPAKADIGLLAFYSCLDLDGKTEGLRDSVESIVPSAVSKKGSLPFGAGGCRVAPVFSLREPGSSISPVEGKRAPSRRERAIISRQVLEPICLG